MNDISANCVFCDQVREEASGKLILIGVISGDLFIERPEEERTMSLTQFIQIRGLEPGSYDFQLKIEKHHEDERILSAALPGHFKALPEDLEVSIIAEGLKVQVNEECTIKAVLQLGDSKPMVVGAFRIVFYPEEDPAEEA